MGFFRKGKPRVYRIVKVWQKNGVDCWEMPAKDFDKLYAGENVVQIDGHICASLHIAGNDIMIYRGT